MPTSTSRKDRVFRVENSIMASVRTYRNSDLNTRLAVCSQFFRSIKFLSESRGPVQLTSLFFWRYATTCHRSEKLLRHSRGTHSTASSKARIVGRRNRDLNSGRNIERNIIVLRFQFRVRQAPCLSSISSALTKSGKISILAYLQPRSWLRWLRTFQV